jgi:membrane glycosyltransferase
VALGLGLGAFDAASGGLWALTLLLLLLPRLLGVLAVQLRGEQRVYGGSARLWASALLELMLSGLQAPLRMLAHSAFVLGALTGLRLDWKSPSREAAAVAWRDAMSRIGVLALPALGLALLMLVLHHTDPRAPHLAPLLLPLLLAVPFTVWSGGAGAGRVMQRAGLLSVPEEGQPPRTLQRGAHKRGFHDLMPAPTIALPRPTVQARGRVALTLAGTALVALVLLPRTALSPELPAGLLAFAPRVEAPAAEASQPIRVAVASTPRPPRSRPYRPASTIDDDVRRRAYESVAQMLGTENS